MRMSEAPEVIGEETALAKVEGRMAPLMTRENREVIQAMAYDIWASGAGFLPAHIKTEEQARVTMYYGYEIGLPPMAALMEVYIVHGRPSLQSKAMLALLRQRPDLGYAVWGECNDEEANLTLMVNTPEGYVPQHFRWTVEDSKRAGIYGDMHKKYPRAMNRNRVISEAMRATFPDLLLGCAYTPEELGAPLVVVGQEVEVDRAALAEGRVVKQNASPDPEDVAGGPDFDAPPPRGQALDTAPSEEEMARADIQAAVGAVLENLLPPEDGEPPMWAIEAEPATKKQTLDTILKIGVTEEHGKVLGAVAVAQGATSAPDIWAAVRGWWYDGMLPAKLYEGLCDQAGVTFEVNPFMPREAPTPAPDGDSE